MHLPTSTTGDAISHFGMTLILALGLLVLPGQGISQEALPLYPQGLVSLSDPDLYSPYFFLVDKNRRFLRVYKNEAGQPKMVLEVPSDLGKNAGPKQRENDHKTPVGIYFLLKKLSQPEIPFSLYGSMAFTTDYPNIFDRREAKTGSGIWLHSVPDTVPLTRGSRGCVVVRNNVIKDLEQYVKLGQTPLIIFEDLRELPKPEYEKQQKEFLGFVETWRGAWQNEDVDTYIKFYDPTFRNSNMDYQAWYNHKKKLKGQYKTIEVKISAPLIVWNANQVVIRFYQEYKSDRHQDYGEKTIHASYSADSGFKIVREDWVRKRKKGTSDNPQRSMTTLNQ